MGRYREYSSDADRQRAYRKRKAEEETQLRKSLLRHRTVSVKLVKVLGMLGSEFAGERDNAARKATQILQEAGLTWYDVLGVEESKDPFR